MTTAIQFRRGSTEEHLTFTGLQGEITVDTSKKTAVVHDEETISGFPLAREDLSNVNTEHLANKGLAKSDMSNVNCEDIANRAIAKQDLSNVSLESFVEKGILKDDLSNVKVSASQTQKGPIEIASDSDIEKEKAVDKATTPAQVKTIVKKYAKNPSSYINGLTLDYLDNTRFVVSYGECRDSYDEVDIIFDGEVAKRINGPWEEGSNLGALAPTVELLPNNNYYVFAMTTEDGSKQDVSIDNNITGWNILEDPKVKSAGLAHIRCVGIITTDGSSNIREFETQRNSSEEHQYNFINPVLLLNTTEGKTDLLTLNTPATYQVLIYATAAATGGNPFCKIKLQETSRNELISSGGSSFSFATLYMWMRTNFLSQIQYTTDVSDGTADFNIYLTGFKFNRVL